MKIGNRTECALDMTGLDLGTDVRRGQKTNRHMPISPFYGRMDREAGEAKPGALEQRGNRIDALRCFLVTN